MTHTRHPSDADLMGSGKTIPVFFLVWLGWRGVSEKWSHGDRKVEAYGQILEV